MQIFCYLFKIDDLDFRRVSKIFGGKQTRMRKSRLTDKGCFGKYHNVSFELQPGCEQNMIFSENDEGLFYLSSGEKIRRIMTKKCGRVRKGIY
jgi:hypothetical protein